MGQHAGINIFENVFTEIEIQEIQQQLKSATWQYGQYSNKTTEIHKKFWFMDLMSNDFFTTHCFNKICSLLQGNWSLLRTYANGQTYGQDGYWHLDSENPNEFTFLYYANPDWKVTWNGETVFNTNNNIISFVPKPNAALFFPGNIFHYAKSPSRDFYDLRTTIAFKIKIEN